ncbi:MAG: hypothetical protein ACI8SE_000565, partial [Bacteroidia bacterium]
FYGFLNSPLRRPAFLWGPPTLRFDTYEFAIFI